MRLILVRHGNTFNKGDKIVRIGCEQDTLLVEEGKKQALNIGKAIKEKGIELNAIYSSNLKRAYQTAEGIIDGLGKNIQINVDNRIDEINYGKWSGLTDNEIIEKYGKEALDDWNLYAKIPSGAGWIPQESVLLYTLRSFCAEMQRKHKRGNVLAVTSNGVLKFFLKLVPSEFDKAVKEKNVKVNTGNCVDVKLKTLSEIKINKWNVPPEEL